MEDTYLSKVHTQTYHIHAHTMYNTSTKYHHSDVHVALYIGVSAEIACRL